jgi:hypothetical protein
MYLESDCNIDTLVQYRFVVTMNNQPEASMTAPLVQVPTTLQQAKELIEKLSLPLPAPDLLRQIGQEEGDHFKNSLATAASEQPNSKAARDYLLAVLTSYSPATANVIRNLGLTPPEPQQLLPVVKQEGKTIRSAISALHNGQADPTTAAYLRAQLEHMDLPPYAPAQINTPPSQQGRSGPNNVAIHPAAARAASQSGAPEDYDDMPVDAPPSEEAKPEIQSAHLYAGKAAFCFTKNKTQTGVYPTITIDSARALPGAERQYDWKHKIIFQLTVSELPLVYGVFMGYLPELRLAGHGKANNKSLSIKAQDGGYFMSMQMSGDGTIAIPAPAKDTFRITLMLMEQMKANFPTLDEAEIRVVARRVCDKHVNPVQRQAVAA